MSNFNIQPFPNSISHLKPCWPGGNWQTASLCPHWIDEELAFIYTACLERETKIIWLPRRQKEQTANEQEQGQSWTSSGKLPWKPGTQASSDFTDKSYIYKLQPLGMVYLCTLWKLRSSSYNIVSMGKIQLAKYHMTWSEVSRTPTKNKDNLFPKSAWCILPTKL